MPGGLLALLSHSPNGLRDQPGACAIENSRYTCCVRLWTLTTEDGIARRRENRQPRHYPQVLIRSGGGAEAYCTIETPQRPSHQRLPTAPAAARASPRRRSHTYDASVIPCLAALLCSACPACSAGPLRPRPPGETRPTPPEPPRRARELAWLT